ncbi:hypothetical protein NL676_003298 [Syzygium grande]|nr:hypothetical protein NL676_003298 [Syzygium grande]
MGTEPVQQQYDDKMTYLERSRWSPGRIGGRQRRSTDALLHPRKPSRTTDGAFFARLGPPNLPIIHTESPSPLDKLRLLVIQSSLTPTMGRLMTKGGSIALGETVEIEEGGSKAFPNRGAWEARKIWSSTDLLAIKAELDGE